MITAPARPIRTIADTIPARNRTIAPQVLAWVGEYLTHPDGPHAGEPLTLTREQGRIFARWFSVDARGRFVYRRGVLRRCKGWGKSPCGAALCAIELCGPCRCDGFDSAGMPVAVPAGAPWVVAAAVSLDQTRNTTHALMAMFSPAAHDEYALELGRTVVHSRYGRIDAVTSNPRAIEGARSTFVLADEVQEWLPHNNGVGMAEAIRRNLAKMGSARSLELANAFRPDEGSVAEISHLAWEKAGGDIPGVMYDSLEAPHVEDLHDVPALRDALLAARGDSVWLDADRLIAEIQDPTTPAGVSRRYYLNSAVPAVEDNWMDPELWDSLARPGERIPDGATVVLGFDGGYTTDHTALVAIEVRKGGARHLDLVAVWKPDGTPGWTVPVLDVEDAIRAACERWKVVEIVADPSRWQRSLEILQQELGNRWRTVSVFPQQSATRMVEATQAFMQACANATLTHSGDPILRGYVLNAIVSETAQGFRLRKRTQRLKIDACVAAVMALSRSLSHERRAATCYSGAEVLDDDHVSDEDLEKWVDAAIEELYDDEGSEDDADS